jgi:hypothetical protein
VLEPGTSAALLTRIKSVLADGRGLGGVIEALTGAYGASLTAIPAFAVALAEGDDVRVAVRGDFAFDIDATAAERVSGAGVTTWTERVIPGVVRVALTTAGSDSPAEFPIADGIVLASTIEWDAASAVPADRDAPVVAGAPAPVVPAVPEAPVVAETRVGHDDTPETDASARRVDGPARVPASAPGTEQGTGESAPVASAAGLIDSSAVHSVADAETLLPLDSALAPPAATADTVVPAPAALPGSAPIGEEGFASTTGYDDLWGATVIRSVEDAAVRPDGEDEEGAPAATPTPAGDHDGATISLAQARALRDAAGGAGGAASGVPLDSTPAPLAPPRPPAPGRVRVSTGQVLPLDRTVVIGRRPRSTRVSGTDLPHLVAVDSPQQDISRSHVELRVEGESIVATDLRTTNGTTLLRQGADPVRLHPGEGTVVVPGDVLDLGDGITVAIEGVP